MPDRAMPPQPVIQHDPRKYSVRFLLFTAIMLSGIMLAASLPDRVQISTGIVEGSGKQASGVRSFKGIPFAQPPIGNLRWKPPQPPENWKGVRRATQFGPRCMQHPVYGDMNFRSNGMSEDCLYLNVWTPADPDKRLKQRKACRYWFTSTVEDSSQATVPSHAMTARAWPSAASSSSA